VVEKAYNHKPLYLIAKENGEIKGVLPLFLMKKGRIIFEKKTGFGSIRTVWWGLCRQRNC